ncbi:MAG TPA: hypothetical protein VM711_02415 [Sphingomicrobium sp.]|nr:hypothetical protein [Sphingomicrobium sp.]
MTRSRLALVLSLALAGGACAQQPPKNSSRVAAQAARWGVSPYVLVTAENRGYWPQMREGKVFFCRSAAVIGSNIASEECLDAGLMVGRLGREQDEQRRSQDALQKSEGYCIPKPLVGC